MMKYIRERK